MHSMKTRMITGTAAALVAATILTGCGGSKAGSGDTIKIGMNLELTGGQAAYGNDSQKGAQLAVEEINKNGGVLGKKLELVPADNKSEPSEAAAAAQKLADEGVVTVIGPLTTSAMLAAVPIMDGAKVPSVTPSATNPKVTVDEKTGKVLPYVFQTCFIDPYQGEVMANYAYKELNARKAVILIDNSSDYAKGLSKYFEDNFTKLGGEVLGSEAYLQKDTDFNATLTKIKALNPDFVYVPGYYQEVGLILKQARAMGMTMAFGGGDGWDSPTLSEIAGPDALVNAYCSTLFTAEEGNKKSEAFIKAYQDKYSAVPSYFSALTYETVQLLAKALGNANSTEPDKVRDALEKVSDFEGLAGSMKFNANHNAIRPAYILTYKDGKPVFAGKISAE